MRAAAGLAAEPRISGDGASGSGRDTGGGNGTGVGGGGGSGAGEPLPKLKERLGRIVDRGQEAYMQLRAVMARADHPISRNGYLQAERLSGAIHASAALSGVERASVSGSSVKEAEDAETHAAILSVLHSTRAVWSSPATRAVQTAQVAMLPLLGAEGTIELKANARQKRGMTNPNTSIGYAVGDAIHERCVEKLRDLAAGDHGVGDESTLAQIEAAKLDTLEADSPWWSDKPEVDRDFQARVAELVMQIRHSPCESLVLVAHNDVFHELLGRYTSNSTRMRQGALLDQLAAGSVPPCALIWCCLDFGRESAQPITDVVNAGELLRTGAPDLSSRRAASAEQGVL